MRKLILLLPCLILVLTGCGAKKSADLSNNVNKQPVGQTASGEVVNKTDDNVVYQNKRFWFSLNLPARWRGYKVEETKDNSGYYYSFELKNKQALNNGYGKPFVLGVFNPEAWVKLKNKIPRPWIYINENNDYVFAYVAAQDDEGYSGFPELIPEEEYHGPLYDVKTSIIPSFTFVTPEERPKTETYVNKKYNYSFDYPAAENLRIANETLQSIVDQASVLVVKAETEDNSLNFEALMAKRIKLLCDADGVSSSITCPRYAGQPVAFKTNFDLPAYKLTFIEQTTEFEAAGEPKVTNKNKTIYVVNLGGKAEARIMLAIIPLTDDLALANDVVLSVRHNK